MISPNMTIIFGISRLRLCSIYQKELK